MSYGYEESYFDYPYEYEGDYVDYGDEDCDYAFYTQYVLTEEEEAALDEAEWRQDFVDEPPATSQSGGTLVKRWWRFAHRKTGMEAEQRHRTDDRIWRSGRKQPVDKGSAHPKSRKKRAVRYGRQHSTWRGHGPHDECVRWEPNYGDGRMSDRVLTMHNALYGQ